MTRTRLAWIFGLLAATACGTESTGNGPTGSATGTTGSPTGSTGSGGTASSSGTAGTGSGTVTMGAGTGGDNSGTAGVGGAGPGSSTVGTAGSTSVGTGGGSGGSGGSGAMTDSGATGGSGVMDGSVPRPDGPAPGGCSSTGAAPTPPAGFTKVTTPPDMKFPFTTHWMGTFSDTSKCISMTSLTDLDNDGDQDFASGQRDPMSSCGTAGAPMIWWEYCSPDQWVKHTVGTGYHSAASGGAGDFDGDGWIDLVAGDSWFKNPGAGVRTAASWTRYGTGAPPVTEEITMGDLTGDGKLDAVYVENTFDPVWGTPGANPTQMWTMTRLSAYRQQQGGSIGDLDGDGKNDVMIGDRWWYKNPGGAGMFTPVPIAAFTAFAASGTNGSAPMTIMGDLDGDGDNDVAMHTHWGGNIAWLENNGTGTMFTGHMIAPNGNIQAKSNLHGLLIADFDNDGDADIYVAQNQGSQFIYENNGMGTFTEHVVANGPGHEVRTADVDCDGDLDVVGKPWGNPAEGRGEVADNALRAHVYYKNELVERGGKAVFDRPKVEVWNVPNKGRCRP